MTDDERQKKLVQAGWLMLAIAFALGYLCGLVGTFLMFTV